MYTERKAPRSRSKTKTKRTAKPSIPFNLNRSNRFQLPPGTTVDYKSLNILQKYVTDRGKIVARRISGVSAKKQREIVTAIKRARYLGLLTMGVRK